MALTPQQRQQVERDATRSFVVMIAKGVGWIVLAIVVVAILMAVLVPAITGGAKRAAYERELVKVRAEDATKAALRSAAPSP